MANHRELCERVAKKLEVPRRAVDAIVDQFFDEVVDALRREEPVTLLRFGRFYFTYRRVPAPLAENIRKRKLVNPMIRVCRFKFIADVRKEINGIDEDVGLEIADPKRIDYKQLERTRNIPQIRAEIEREKLETERRAAAGITLDEICSEMERDLDGDEE